MPYADYTYYSNTYQGSAISQDAFAALARQASLYIDRITFNRLNTGTVVTDAIRNATCAVAETLQNYKSASANLAAAASLKSEKAGGWSVEYQSATDISAAVLDAVTDAAYPYLIYTGLMDRGIC